MTRKRGRNKGEGEFFLKDRRELNVSQHCWEGDVQDTRERAGGERDRERERWRVRFVTGWR